VGETATGSGASAGDRPASARASAGTEDLRRGWLTRGVAGVGAASFLSDSGHEVATATLPSFLISVLHSSAAALGLIEGISDALTGVAKLLAGPLANDPHRRGRIASGGYLGTALATAAIGLAATVWQVGVLRALAWVSRGLRSPARDSLLASLAPGAAMGRAFGLERAGDNLGAVVGPLLAAVLVSSLGIRPTFYFALIPGVGAAAAITLAAHEARHLKLSPGARARLQLGGLRRAGLLGPLLPVAMFECGNVATTLLILRATQLLHSGPRSVAAAASLAILIYAAHNAIAAMIAYAGGHWIDRIGARLVFAAGAALYVVAYVGFAAGPHAWLALLLAFSLAGAGIGLAEAAESTLVAQLLPDRLRGSGFGVLGAVQAAGDLVATVVAAALYTTVSPAAGFLYAVTWMVLTLSTMLLARPRGASQRP
jgi:MFS family permease